MDSFPIPIAITGATGLIGRALCGYLGGRGFQVRALVRRHDPELAAFANTTLVDCDLPGRIDASSLSGCHAVIHAAYVTRFRSLAEAKRVNETGTRAVLEASRRAGVPRFVFISTTSAHASARSYYGQSKHRLEGAMDPDRDLIVRPGLVLSASGGLFGRMIKGIGPTARRWTVPLFGGGRQPLQTIHIDDLCEGFRLALQGEVVGALTLASPEQTTFRDFFSAVAERLGRPVRFVRVPIRPALAALRVAEWARIPLPVSSENLRGLVGLRHWDTGVDLGRIELRVRSMKEALDSLAISRHS